MSRMAPGKQQNSLGQRGRGATFALSEASGAQRGSAVSHSLHHLSALLGIPTYFHLLSDVQMSACVSLIKLYFLVPQVLQGTSTWASHQLFGCMWLIDHRTPSSSPRTALSLEREKLLGWTSGFRRLHSRPCPAMPVPTGQTSHGSGGRPRLKPASTWVSRTPGFPAREASGLAPEPVWASSLGWSFNLVTGKCFQGVWVEFGRNGWDVHTCPCRNPSPLWSKARSEREEDCVAHWGRILTCHHILG